MTSRKRQIHASDHEVRKWGSEAHNYLAPHNANQAPLDPREINVKWCPESIEPADLDRCPAHLHVALDEVERGDGHVGEPAAGDPSGRAGGVERRRVELDLLLGRLDRDGRTATSSSRGRGRGGDGDGEARGGGGEGARRGGGVEEAREERLAGAVGERHRRREIRKIRLSRGGAL